MIMETNFFSSSLPISYHGFPTSLLHPSELENNPSHPFYLSFQDHEEAIQSSCLLPGNPNLQQNVFPSISMLSSDNMGTFVSHNSSSNSASVTCVEEMEFSGSRELGFSGGYGDFVNQQVLHRPYSLINNELSLTLGSSREIVLPQSGNNSRTGERNDPRNPNSRYMTVMEQILAEIASYALENLSELDDSVSSSCSSERTEVCCSSERNELISMLEMIDEGYSRCLLQIQSVVKKFQVATNSEVGQTAAHLAMREISRFHRSLREKIMAQIQEEERSLASPQMKNEQQTWRPQRGLPEKSVAVLRAWMFQNFLHPYPKDSEKHLLAMKSGLTRSQVSNWFINARVRLWKPMIEEMHSEVCKKEQTQEMNGDPRGRQCIGSQQVGF